MYAAGAAELKIGSALSDAPGSALATRSVMSATWQSAPIQTKSSGKRIPFIQKEVVRPSGNTNSIPLWGARLSRSPKPLPRSSGVSATSASNATPPMITAGLVDGGAAVGVGVCVDVGVDVGVDAGVDTRVGIGVGADAGGGLGVAVDFGMDVAVATSVADGAITIGGADVDVDLGAAVGLGADMAAAATAVGDGATAILGGRTDAVGARVGGAAGGLGAAQPAVIANTIAAIARAGGSAALITVALRQLHEGCAVAATLARFRLE